MVRRVGAQMCEHRAMLLADAIEQWGIAHRQFLDEDDKNLLRRVWGTTRSSEIGEIEIDELRAAEGRRLMSLFPKTDRSSIASFLNSAVTWVADGKKRPSASAERLGGLGARAGQELPDFGKQSGGLSEQQRDIAQKLAALRKSSGVDRRGDANADAALVVDSGAVGVADGDAKADAADVVDSSAKTDAADVDSGDAGTDAEAGDANAAASEAHDAAEAPDAESASAAGDKKPTRSGKPRPKRSADATSARSAASDGSDGQHVDDAQQPLEPTELIDDAAGEHEPESSEPVAVDDHTAEAEADGGEAQEQAAAENDDDVGAQGTLALANSEGVMDVPADQPKRARRRRSRNKATPFEDDAPRSKVIEDRAEGTASSEPEGASGMSRAERRRNRSKNSKNKK